jgi:hypothetical protein
LGVRGVFVWLCLVFAASAPGALAQTSWGLPELMNDMARVHSASARFTERETMQMLNAPLLVSGFLSYRAPGYLRKHTVSAAPEDFILDDGQITMSGADQQTRVFSEQNDPRIGGLVEGIRATLAGDLPALQRFYNLQLSGNATAWQLVLRPKDAGTARFVKWILLQGSQNRIKIIDTASGNGDHSEMSVIEDLGNGG